MARLGAQSAGIAALTLLLLFLISLECHITGILASRVTSSVRPGGHDVRGNGRVSAALQRDVETKSGLLDLTTLRRGDVYAININGDSTFRLEPIDLARLQLSRYPLTTASFTAVLRGSYPGENVGWAWFADTYWEDGWYRLEIRIDEDAPFPDVIKARAAGFVEGNLQGQHIYRYWTNYRSNEYRGRGEMPSQELYEWLDEQYNWMMRHVERATGWSPAMLRGAEQPKSITTTTTTTGTSADTTTVSDKAFEPHDPDLGSAASRGPATGTPGGGGGGAGVVSSVDRRYWMLVGLVAAQFEGLTAGFWASVTDSERNMTWHELYTLNALGDLYELNVLFPPSAEPPPLEVGSSGAATPAAVPQRHYTPGHGEVGEYGYGELLDCSAVIKLDMGSSNDDEEEDDVDGDGAGSGSIPGSGSKGLGDKEGLQGGLWMRGGSQKRRRALQQTSLERHQQQQQQQAGGQRRTEAAREGEGTPASSPRRVKNFWAAHNTWRPYYDMVRTWKVYDLPWAASGPVTVSSSPGLLHSKDDWYTTDKFVVMETTNGIYNKELYDLIQPKCVLMWQRAQVANLGAREGSEWVDLFGRQNSGTYNNQWMVLDVQRLQRYGSDVLWVLEQVPGRTISKDVTKVLLEQGYWASYNVPYFPEIYNLTGYPQPSIYHTCPRARIFSREQRGLSSRADVMSLMRLNHYDNDPLSLGLPNNAIAARYDLPAMPDAGGQHRNWTQKAYGAVDAKVVDWESFQERRTYVVNGPTSDDQPVFRWSAEPLFDSIRHDGCADEFNFGWRSYESVVGPPMF